MKPPSSSDSQAALAASIVRQVQSELPAPEADEGLAGSVGEALREEGRVNELGLAYLRAAALAVFTVVAALAHAQPVLIGAADFPAPAIGVAGAGLVASVGLLVALRSGWYHPRLRHLVPAADALLIGVSVLLLAFEPWGQRLPGVVGVASVGAAACVFLAFSGAVRLSRSSQRLATMLALVDWAFLWLMLPPLQGVPGAGAFIAAMLIATGVFGTRFTRVIRRLVANEVARDRLGHLYRDAAAAIDARQEVLQMVAHDLRNPLNTVALTAEMLQEMPGDDADARARALSIITRNSRSMERLIHDLLDVARLEAGNVAVDPVVSEVDEVLDRVLELMRPNADRAGIALESTVGPDLPPVEVDRERIVQVFSNLIGNALKFTPEGGLVTIRASRAGDKVRFAVVDTGPGIPPDRVAHIFERFWQASSGDRRGIGLGLAISRSIVEAHGERIGVESQAGGGSTFWFTVPIAHGAPVEPRSVGSPVD